MNASDLLLEVDSLSLEISGQRILDDISFSISTNETVGLVGESGSGKSMIVKAILGFTPNAKGRIAYKGRPLLNQPEKTMNAIRGKEIGLVCQNSMTALNPTLPIGRQLLEGIIIHKKLSVKQASSLAATLLADVGLNDPTRMLGLYPDQLSGGMKQRVVIAMAIACSPSLLVADEPTSSLDSATQSQIIQLLFKIQKEHKMSVLLVSHDLGLVANCCNKVLVLQSGTLVDCGSAQEIFHHSQHPYTRELCWKRI